MEAKSVERIAEELGVNFYDLYPYILMREAISFKAGIKEVVELDKDITQHLMQDGSGNWSVESWRLKAWFKKRQAKLKKWGIKND